MHVITDPQSPEEAVIMLLMQAGRRLRTRHVDDELDPSTFPLAKQLIGGAGLRVSDLAARLELDASTVSRQIKQLEDRAVIVRTPDPDDGRACLVQLTPAGEQMLHDAFRRRYNRISTALEQWSDTDRARLQTLLTRLSRDLERANDAAMDTTLQEARSTS